MPVPLVHQVEVGLSLVQEMASQGVEANERTFSALIKAVSSANCWDGNPEDSNDGTWSKVRVDRRARVVHL